MTDATYRDLRRLCPQFGRALLEGFEESARRVLSSGSLMRWTRFRDAERIRLEYRLRRAANDRQERASAMRWARVTGRLMSALEEEFRIVPADRRD